MQLSSLCTFLLCIICTVYCAEVCWNETNHCYWEAHQNCSLSGGYLLTINNEQEKSFLNNVPWNNNGRFWIGLHRIGSNTWAWMNGEPLTFSDWAPGEPNDLFSNENCTTVYASNDFQWDDVLCDTNSGNQYFDNPFICEKNPQPIEGTPENTLGIVIGCTIGGIILTIVIVALLVLRKRKKSRDHLTEIEMKPPRESIQLRDSTLVPSLSGIVIKEALGSGRFGEVFLGVMGEKNVALKSLRNQDFKEFQKELVVLFNIGEHPNIVRLLGTFHSDTSLFMVLEYMNQGSLLSFIKEKQDEISPELQLNLCKGICNGMSYLADRNVIHRDLSAKNCLVNFEGEKVTVKIGDFGMGKILNEDYYRADNTAPLPIRWTAPEALERGRFTTASDVWSFGVVCWEVYSYGRLPYDWLSNKEVSEQVPMGERLPKPKSCAKEIWIEVIGCFKINPAERPTFAILFISLSKLSNSTSIERSEDKKDFYTTNYHEYNNSEIK